MFFKKFKKIKILNILIHNKKHWGKKSYSQCGEDLIVKFIFTLRGIYKPSYIDIGAYHPFNLSNTALFYTKGSRGINIEPNPIGISPFYKYRRNDINLNIGISSHETYLDYYCMNVATMNTFDALAAEDLVRKYGFTIVEIKKIFVKTLPHVIKKYIDNNLFPDFLSLDVEGLDMDILTQIDYEKNFPKVICVETVEYTSDGTGIKNVAIIDYLQQNGYFIYADTYINTIFVNKKFWYEKL
jgi:hypothetical protein